MPLGRGRKDTHMDITTIVGLITSFTLLTMTILSGGSLSAFIDAPSFLITGGGTVAAFLVSSSLNDTAAFMGTLRYLIYFPPRIYANVHPQMWDDLNLSKPAPASDEEVEQVRRDLARGVTLLRRIRPYPLGVGALGSLVGIVNMLQHVDDPSQIGPGLATALLTVVYGVMLTYLIILPFSQKLEARLASLDERFW
jgi:chemotaxis protein MotA